MLKSIITILFSTINGLALWEYLCTCLYWSIPTPPLCILAGVGFIRETVCLFGQLMFCSWCFHTTMVETLLLLKMIWLAFNTIEIVSPGPFHIKLMFYVAFKMLKVFLYAKGRFKCKKLFVKQPQGLRFLCLKSVK